MKSLHPVHFLHPVVVEYDGDWRPMTKPSEPRKPEPDGSSDPKPVQFGDTIGFIESVEPLQTPNEPGFRDPYLWSEGDQVGRYTILKLIARGGMSYVYLGVETGTRNRVAIKVLPPSPLWTERAIARFDREISVLARIRHPNVVRFIEGGVRNAARYYVMEYIPGDTVEDILQQKRRCSPAEAASIVRALARVLHAIHEQGIIHRDVKPSNVIITPRGVPKIADFGIARILEDESLTLTSEIVGTPFYMSPEQIQGKKDIVDRRTDVYSLGVILYELIARQLPFGGENLATVTYNVVHSDPVPPSTISPYRVPKALDVITLRALEKDPSRRTPSALALADELDLFLGGADITHSVGERARQGLRFLKAHAGAVGISLGLVALLLVGLAVVPSILSNLIPRTPSAGGGPDGPDPPPPAPGIDEAKETGAASLLDAAKALFEKDDWWNALERYKRMAEGYADTKVYQSAQTAIGDAITRCRERIAALDKSIEESRRSAEGAYRRAEWSTAKSAYETLADIAVGPYEREKPEWVERAKECGREHGAAVDLQQLQKLEAEQRWSMLESGLRKYNEQYTGTRTHREGQALLKALANRGGPEAEAEVEIYEAESLFKRKKWEELERAISHLMRHMSTDAWRKRESDVREWEVRSKTEPPAEALYKEILANNAKQEWVEVRDKLVLLRSDHASSLVLKENAGKLDGIENDASTALSGKTEEDARIRLKEAEAYYKNKKYREAHLAVSDLLDGKFRGTKFVDSNRSGILELRKDLEKVEVIDLYGQLRAARNGKNWAEAYDVGRQLWTKYMAGDLLSDAKKQEVWRWFDESVAGLTRMDMNGSIDDWKKNDLGTSGKPGEISQIYVNQSEPSDKCLRLVGSTSPNGTIFYVPAKIVPEAKILALRISADRPNASVQVLLGVKGQESLGSPSNYYTSPPVSAPQAGLQRVERGIGEFKVPASGIRTGETNPFAYVGILVPSGVTVFIDNIEFRVQK